MIQSLIPIGIILSISGTLLAGLIGLLGRKAHRPSAILLALATWVGAASALAFLIGTGEEVVFPFPLLDSFKLDTLSVVFLLLVNGVACAVALYGLTYFEHEAEHLHLPVTNFLTALFILGMQGVLLASNTVGFILFWEVMSMTSFFLVMAQKKQSSLYAALFYLVMTHLGAGALMAGFFLSSGGELFMPFADMRQSLEITMTAGGIGVPLMVIFLFFFFGFGSKAGLIPFHAWLPEAHPEAPSPISALMSGAMLKVAVYGLLRVLITILPAPGLLSWGILLILAGLVSAVYGALYAVVHTDLKRILAFSSIENIGLIILMIGAMVFSNSMGWTELGNAFLGIALLHSLAHAVFKSGLFMGAGAILSEVHDGNIEKMGGLAARMPRLALAMLVLSLGAAGLPPLGAFTSEWLLIRRLMEGIQTGVPLAQGVFVVMLAGVALVAGLTIFAMTRLFGIIFLAAPRSEEAARAKEPSRGLAFPVLFIALLTVGIGFLAPILFGQTTPLAPLMMLLLILGLLVFGARRLFSNVSLERSYHTWDCGQRIIAGMEYTGTAFAAPIRFFFRSLLAIKKEVNSSPVTPTNAWIKTYALTMPLRSIFWDFLYVPIRTAVLWSSSQIRKIQNGSLRFYIGLMLTALMVTFIFAS